MTNLQIALKGFVIFLWVWYFARVYVRNKNGDDIFDALLLPLFECLAILVVALFVLIILDATVAVLGS